MVQRPFSTKPRIGRASEEALPILSSSIGRNLQRALHFCRRCSPEYDCLPWYHRIGYLFDVRLFCVPLRLQNILNNRYRLGVQLYDAIVVKVLFFDERKQPVDTGYLNPGSGAPIDNSDKSYSFSNYWRIDDFPWGRVRGRSYNYPFSEGDIPDQARYVRLFFGLKGTGTLWLDNINFGYSKWNFTALERFEPFFDKHLTLAERLIPTPKHIEKIDDIP
jgi:hypothetical protein